MHGRNLFRSAVASAALLTGAITTSRAATLPALNHPSTTTANPGKFEWADLFTGDLNTAQQFYTGVFGWTASDTTNPRSYKKDGERRDYVVLLQNGVPIAGLVQRSGAVSKSEHPARWIGYIAVADLKASLKAVTAAGGKVAMAEHRVPERGKQAGILDPEGSVVGLLQSSSGDLMDQSAGNGQWTWFELYAAAPKTAGAFYQQAFNYQIGPDTHTNQADHYLISTAGHDRGGIAPLPFPEAKPDWLGFIRVDDIDATVAKVTSSGGEVIVAPEAAKGDLDSRFSIISDPTGGVFGLVQFTSPTTSP